MQSFVKYGSHQKVIEICNEKGIKNTNDQPFQRNALIKLLTNSKYIGKWYINEESKDLDQESLPEMQRYHEIELPHGAVIPMDLWDRVQKTVKDVAGNLGKTTRVTRVYPLSGGILKLHDGSTFRGCSGTGQLNRFHYYFNQQNNLRIKCELFEQNAIHIVSKLINNSPELQRAIRDAGDETQDNIQFLQQRVKELKKSLDRNESEKKQFLKKMDLLIGNDASPEDILLFKDEFRSLLKNLNEEKEKVEQQITQAQQELKSLEQTSFSWVDIASHAQRVQELMLEKDPVALKRAYYSLFKSIIVGPEDKMGNRNLTYVLNHSEDHDESLEDGTRHSIEMVEVGATIPLSYSYVTS